jgi:hypothetical protein
VSHIPLAPKSSIAALRIEPEIKDIFSSVIDKKSNTDDIKNLEQILSDL